MSLSKESFVEAKRRLEALDKKDAERRRTAELKNNLEGYIYATKEKVWNFLLIQPFISFDVLDFFHLHYS